MLEVTSRSVDLQGKEEEEMKMIMEQFGSSIIYAIAGSGMAAILIGFLMVISS